MYKFRVKYTDMDDNQREEDLYFNYTERELATWQVKNGNLMAYLERLVNQFNAEDMMIFLEAFVQGAYGIKSDDGRSFDKGSSYVKNFKYSMAYDAYITLLLSDRKKAEEFIVNVVPKKFKEDMLKEMAGKGNDGNLSISPLSSKE